MKNLNTNKNKIKKKNLTLRRFYTYGGRNVQNVTKKFSRPTEKINQKLFLVVKKSNIKGHWKFLIIQEERK